MKMLFRWIINAGALLLIAEFLPGVFVSGWYSALIVALILGLVNIILKPILIFFTLPINIITLGLFTLFINAFLFWFVSTFIKGFIVFGFWSAFIGALFMSLTNWLVHDLLKN